MKTKLNSYILLEILVAIFTVLPVFFLGGDLFKNLIISMLLLLLQFITTIFLKRIDNILSLFEIVLYKFIIVTASILVVYFNPEDSILIKVLLIIWFHLEFIFMMAMSKYCKQEDTD